MAYEINININGDIDTGDTTKTTGISKVSSDSQEKSQKALVKYISSQTIQPFLQEVKTQVSQDISIVTGNSELQERVNFGMQVVQFGVNTYKNASAGIIVGQAAGLSAGTGALLGIALTAINTAIQIGMNQYQINLQKRIESYQLTQIRDRQGIAYNKSRS